MATINELDDDLLGRILSELSFSDLIQNVELVNHRWSRVSLQRCYAVRELKLTLCPIGPRYGAWNSLETQEWLKFKRCAPHLKKLNITFSKQLDWSDEDLQRVLSMLKLTRFLQILSLASTPTHKTGYVRQMLGSGMSYLQTLGVTFNPCDYDQYGRASRELVEALTKFPRIRAIQQQLRGKDLVAVLGGGILSLPPSLRVLHLVICKSQSDANSFLRALELLAKQVSQLEVLRVGYCLDEACLEVLGHLKRITYLDIDFRYDCVQHFGRLLRRLSMLKGLCLRSLRVARDFTPQLVPLDLVFTTVVCNAPQLVYFSTPELDDAQPHWFQRLAELRFLRALSFTFRESSTRELVVECLRPIAENGTLEYLHLRLSVGNHLYHWSNASMLELVDKCKKLKYVGGSFRYCGYKRRQLMELLDKRHEEKAPKKWSRSANSRDPRILHIKPTFVYDTWESKKERESEWLCLSPRGMHSSDDDRELRGETLGVVLNEDVGDFLFDDHWH